MTRAEELKKEALKRYGTHLDREMAFLSGAAYADSHPLNPWKSVKDELPKEDLFFREIGQNPVFARWDKDKRAWRDGRGYLFASLVKLHYDYFMPIPELPKEDTK